MSNLEIAWVAGLLEGEGTFSYPPRIRLSMTDKDVVIRAAEIMQAAHVVEDTWDADHITGRQVRYVCTLSGTQAVRWMMTAYGLFGARRQERLKGILSIWKQAKQGTPRHRELTRTVVWRPE